MRAKLSQTALKRELYYDPGTGLFTWAPTRSSRARVGKVAGTLRPDGYLQIRICGQTFLAHRWAVLYMTGRWPAEEVDHVNGIRTDNRWENLREATRQQNAANQKRRTGHRPLPRGVKKYLKRFRARIHVGDTDYHLGMFDTPEEASREYEEVAELVHGVFAAHLSRA